MSSPHPLADGYQARYLDAALDGPLASLPAILIVGPRASGKTTTAGRRAASAVRFDRPGQAAAFEHDPDAALRAIPEPVLLDEWQLVPHLPPEGAHGMAHRLRRGAAPARRTRPRRLADPTA